jgi:putative protease
MFTPFHLPELLAPAGSLEKLKTAILYGADAVYLGGQRFGMRASADNFSEDEIETGVAFAAERGAKVYVVLNAFLHSKDFSGFEEFCQVLDQCGVAAVIASDAGVIFRVKKCSSLAVHLSTQASCINGASGLVWKELGVDRLILGRECSLEDAREIADITGLEVEMFIHGSMCMAYSGHCTISNFTAGRDSNRGGCIQSCRFEYAQVDEKGASAQSNFMSSKDLNGIQVVKDFVDRGISSMKIEGRMKSLLYVATTVQAYRRALNALANDKLTPELGEELNKELNAVPHREYTEASFVSKAGVDSIFDNAVSTSAIASHQFLGTVLETDGSEMLVRLNKPVAKGMNIEVLPFNGPSEQLEIATLRDVLGHSLNECRQDSVVWVNSSQSVAPFAVLRSQSK